jgi:hypothetical protein
MLLNQVWATAAELATKSALWYNAIRVEGVTCSQGAMMVPAYGALHLFKHHLMLPSLSVWRMPIGT